MRHLAQRRAAWWASVVVAALVTAACATTATTAEPEGSLRRTVPSVPSRSSHPLPVVKGERARVSPSRHRHTHLPARFAPLPLPLPAPAPLVPFAAPLPGEGRWHEAGRLVRGHAAVYETTLRPPGSSYEAGLAWMDPRLLRAQLYSGSLSPGGGPWKLTAPISPTAARSLVAAFNGGFKFPATQGGYYAEGRIVYPLRTGGASFVIYRNGDATVGSWGRDVKMTPAVIAVRQNLTLIVDHGQPVAGLNPYDSYVWGSTLGGAPAVWRSGIGVTANGSLVYVTGPFLMITQLAALLVRAGCVRAMTLDMNPAWTVFVTYRPPAPQQLATAGNGTALLPGMVQGPYTFFEPWWARDFITMSAR